jgi:hypothetical protein
MNEEGVVYLNCFNVNTIDKLKVMERNMVKEMRGR